MSLYHIKSLEEYFQACNKSKESLENFWEEIAEEYFIWHKKWDKVYECDMEKPEIKWFLNGKLNITENCLDRHLISNRDKTALIWEPNDPNEPHQEISYGELHRKVCQMANALKKNGIKKGDKVCIYMPMIPELTIALLACARIGAVHSVVFAGFSAVALATRINDCECKMLLTCDGLYRGSKVLNLKEIVDKALATCPTVNSVLVAQRTGEEITMNKERDKWLSKELEGVDDFCEAEVMDAEDPLFILYTSGSTGKPKGMVHTCGGYMVYAAYSFINAFRYEQDDVYWCTADIGWITGHSYIVYGPLLNSATTIMFEGVPTYPDASRFWAIVEKFKVNQFYTAPTAIRALAKEPIEMVKKHDLSSLKVLGSVGEPINTEAWQWYHHVVGNERCPIADTWWQTETGGIMISAIPFCTPTKPTFATLPLPGIFPVLVDEHGETIEENATDGRLCIETPWPSMARTIYGDHERYKQTYFSTFKGKYFTGDGAYRDEVGYYRVTGRVDDVIIVSGHNLGTAPIESAIGEHPAVAESAIVGFPHNIKGNALYGFIILKEEGDKSEQDQLRKEINQLITEHIGAIAKLEKMQFVPGLPKTRSGKIMRRILRNIAKGDFDNFGDTSTLLNPEIVDEIKQNAIL